MTAKEFAGMVARLTRSDECEGCDAPNVDVDGVCEECGGENRAPGYEDLIDTLNGLIDLARRVKG